MPQNAFFPWNCNLLVSKKMMQRHFFPTLHPLSPVLLVTAIVVAFVLLHNSRFNFHCYTQREAMPTQKSARKWRCDLSWLLAQKITKGMHSCRPASQNRPTVHHQGQKHNLRTILHPPQFQFHLLLYCTTTTQSKLTFQACPAVPPWNADSRWEHIPVVPAGWTSSWWHSVPCPLKPITDGQFRTAWLIG